MVAQLRSEGTPKTWVSPIRVCDLLAESVSSVVANSDRTAGSPGSVISSVQRIDARDDQRIGWCERKFGKVVDVGVEGGGEDLP